MSRPAAKGWCPSAYHPMESGDGWILRVRPPLARLTRDQTLALCDAATKFGSGILDVTSRANLQIRGVAEPDIAGLLAALTQIGLVDANPDTESRRNVLVAPDWTDGDDVATLGAELMKAAAQLPDLPAKFGFAIDCGPAPVLGDASADIRLERGENGLVLRADGAATGTFVSRTDAIAKMTKLARWFLDTGGAASKRMARHLAAMPLPDAWQGAAPRAPRSPFGVGGASVGLPFGQTTARALQSLMVQTGAHAIRVTPWRLISLEAAQQTVLHPDFITDANDPRLLIQACPGAPFCASASVPTRDLANKLTGPAHISAAPKAAPSPKPPRPPLLDAMARLTL